MESSSELDGSTSAYLKVVQTSESNMMPHIENESKKPNGGPAGFRKQEGHVGGSPFSPLKWYYPQLAWGKLYSFFKPIMGTSFTGNLVHPHVWISNFSSVCDLPPLQDRGIEHVICAVLGIDPLFPKHLRYTCLDLRDTDDEDIMQYFDRVADLIHEDVRREKSVIVHCRVGISRSVTLVAAYLIKYHGMSSARAIQTIQESRPCANPIPAFRRQLYAYERNILNHH